jgi:hypothetical protein
VRGGGDFHSVPVVEGELDFGGAGAGGIGDPNRVVEVDVSTPLLDLEALLEWLLTGLRGLIGDLGDGLGGLGDGVHVGEHGERARADAGRSNHQDELA